MQLQHSLARLFTATALLACATHCGPGGVSSNVQASEGQDSSLSSSQANATCSQPEGCATANGNVKSIQFTPHSALFAGAVRDPNTVADPNSVTNPNSVLDPNTVADPNALAFADPNHISNPNAVGNANNVGNPNGVGNAKSVGMLILDTSASVCSAADEGQREAEQTRLAFSLQAGMPWQLGTYVVGTRGPATPTSADPNQRALQVNADPNRVANPNGLPADPNGAPTDPNAARLPADPNSVGDPNGVTGSQVTPVVTAKLAQVDATCSATATTALTGTLKLTAVSATQVRGTYDLTTPSGDKLQGTLDAVSCPAASQAHLTCAP